MRFSEHATGPIHTTGYNLRGLEPASVYEVSVVSKNRFGWSDSSRIVRFATIGESKLKKCFDEIEFGINVVSSSIFSVELPNYSTESTEEDTYEQHSYYYDDSSASGLDPHSTMDDIDPYNPYLFGTRHSKASQNSRICTLLIAIICALFMFH